MVVDVGRLGRVLTRPNIHTMDSALLGLVRTRPNLRKARRPLRCPIGAAFALAAMLAASPVVRAQDYPSHPVKIIVPFPAGGTADVMPRIFSDWLSRKWGQAVVVENRTGAAGNIGAEVG